MGGGGGPFDFIVSKSPNYLRLKTLDFLLDNYLQYLDRFSW